MSDLMIVRQSLVLGDGSNLSKETIGEAVQFINGSVIAKRWLLMHLFEAEAYKKVFLLSFEDFCEEHLYLDHSKSYLSDLIRTARVERDIFGPQSMGSLYSRDFPRIPIRAIMELAKLDTADLRQKAYKEYCVLCDAVKGGSVPKTYAIKSLSDIVTRMLNNLPPAPSQSEQQAQLETPPSPADTSDTGEADPFKEETIVSDTPTQTIPSQEQMTGRAKRDTVNETEETKPDFFVQPVADATAPSLSSQKPPLVITVMEKPKPVEMDWEEVEWAADYLKTVAKMKGRLFGPPETQMLHASTLSEAAQYIEDHRHDEKPQEETYEQASDYMPFFDDAQESAVL